jgi:hypothetical protein
MFCNVLQLRNVRWQNLTLKVCLAMPSCSGFLHLDCSCEGLIGVWIASGACDFAQERE